MSQNTTPEQPNTPSWAQQPTQYADWGQPQPPKPSPSRSKKIMTHGITAAIALFVGVGMGSSGGTPSTAEATPAPTVTVHDTMTVTAKPKPAPTVTITKTVKPKAPKAPKKVTIPGEGTYVVGTDIKAGTYKTSGPSDSSFPNCYWARLKDTSGNMNSIIANGNPGGQTTVTIRSSDGAFETSGCNTWTKVS